MSAYKRCMTKNQFPSCKIDEYERTMKHRNPERIIGVWRELPLWPSPSRRLCRSKRASRKPPPPRCPPPQPAHSKIWLEAMLNRPEAKRNRRSPPGMRPILDRSKLRLDWTVFDLIDSKFSQIWKKFFKLHVEICWALSFVFSLIAEGKCPAERVPADLLFQVLEES